MKVAFSYAIGTSDSNMAQIQLAPQTGVLGSDLNETDINVVLKRDESMVSDCIKLPVAKDDMPLFEQISLAADDRCDRLHDTAAQTRMSSFVSEATVDSFCSNNPINNPNTYLDEERSDCLIYVQHIALTLTYERP